MGVNENKALLKTFPNQVPTPKELLPSAIRRYVIKESIIVSSLVDDSRIILSEEEREKLKEEGQFLFYALSLLPKKTDFFWRTVSLISYIKREILKARSFFTYEQKFGAKDFPFPFLADQDFLTDFDFILKQSIKSISSETKKEKIIEGARNILIFLDRMKNKTFTPFFDIVEGREEDVEESYMRCSKSYETNLKFLIMTESKITAFLNFCKIEGTIDKISSKVFKNISGKTGINLAPMITSIKKEGLHYYSGIPEGSKGKIFCQVDFGGAFLQDLESLLAVSPSDFILHFLPKQSEERIRKMNIFFLYQVLKIHQTEGDVQKNIEIDSINNNFAVKDVKIKNKLLEDEYDRLKKIQTLQDVLQNGVVSFYRKVEKTTNQKVFEYLDVDTTEKRDMEAFLSRDFAKRTIELFQFIKEAVYENKEYLPSVQTEFYKALEEEMLVDSISKLMTEVSLKHKEKEKEIKEFLLAISAKEEVSEEVEKEHQEEEILVEYEVETKAEVQTKGNTDEINTTTEDEPKEEKLFTDFGAEYSEDTDEAEQDDECYFED